jgi:ribose 5-phosphate isomerase B
MWIAIGSDHRGFKMKQRVIDLLATSGHNYNDLGCYTEESVDYPDIAREVGREVAKKDYELGILICGTGIGMSIAANKVRGIRAALCCNALGAERARLHNNANILCLGVDTDEETLKAILDKFLNTAFEGGRHQRRVEKISSMECRGGE